MPYYEGTGPEFGKGTDFSPCRGPEGLALDGCTVRSGQVSCVVLED